MICWQDKTGHLKSTSIIIRRHEQACSCVFSCVNTRSLWSWNIWYSLIANINHSDGNKSTCACLPVRNTFVSIANLFHKSYFGLQMKIRTSTLYLEREILFKPCADRQSIFYILSYWGTWHLFLLFFFSQLQFCPIRNPTALELLEIFFFRHYVS